MFSSASSIAFGLKRDEGVYAKAGRVTGGFSAFDVCCVLRLFREALLFVETPGGRTHFRLPLFLWQKIQIPVCRTGTRRSVAAQHCNQVSDRF